MQYYPPWQIALICPLKCVCLSILAGNEFTTQKQEFDSLQCIVSAIEYVRAKRSFIGSGHTEFQFLFYWFIAASQESYRVSGARVMYWVIRKLNINHSKLLVAILWTRSVICVALRKWKLQNRVVIKYQPIIYKNGHVIVDFETRTQKLIKVRFFFSLLDKGSFVFILFKVF